MQMFGVQFAFDDEHRVHLYCAGNRQAGIAIIDHILSARHILEMNTETAIGPVKEFLGEDYTYGEIRAVAADFLRG